MNLYFVTQSEAKNSANAATSLVLAEGETEAAREFVRWQRGSLISDLLVIDQGLHSLLFVAPCQSPLDAAGVVGFSPKDAVFVPFDRDWLNDVPYMRAGECLDGCRRMAVAGSDYCANCRGTFEPTEDTTDNDTRTTA